MDKYLENAFWLALENAVKDRNVESIARILEQMNAAKTMVSQMPSQVESKKRDSLIVEYLASGVIDEFIRIVSHRDGLFTMKDFKEWLVGTGKSRELDVLAPEWRSRMGNALEPFREKTSPLYKGIARNEKRGHYRLMSATNGHGSANDAVLLESWGNHG